MKKMSLTYSEYLDSLSKEEIERILNFFNIHLIYFKVMS